MDANLQHGALLAGAVWHGLGPLFERRVPARLTGINRARGRSAGARVRFPIAVTLVVGTPAPLVTPLIGMPISALDAVTGMPLALMRSR
ncbi:MAG: hypothetical protein ACK51Z_11410 [Pseudomonadota bacterium]